MIPHGKDVFSRLSEPYRSLEGPARAAALASVLGILLSFHLTELLHHVIGTDALLPVDWCMYVSTLCIFHLSEYFLMAQYNPEELSSTAFILNDNPQYQLAQLFLTCEYWAEYLLVPVIKSTTTAPWSWMFWLGTVVMVVGQIIRIASISTAGYAFTHLVKPYRREDHVLVTHGIYSYLRHPGYFGWFWWSVGICITVRNPLSMVAFAYAAFRFFRFRIRHEELELLEMFGQQYEEYRSKTTVGIPGIS